MDSQNRKRPEGRHRAIGKAFQAAWSQAPPGETRRYPLQSDTVRIFIPQQRHAMPDEVLTIKEAAALLKLAEKTVCTMRQASEIPAFKIRGQWRITRAELDRCQGIRRGRLALHSMDAFAGAIGVSDANGRCTPEYIICEPLDDSVIVPEYFGSLLRTMALAGFIQASCPAVRERAPRFRFTDFGEMYPAVPSAVEQRTIVEHIGQQTAKLDAVRAATQRTIPLLKERRAALIAAAVTGQPDLRTAA